MAGICEHVQYKPKLWLEKMELLSNGGGGISVREVKSVRHEIQHNPALILHHTSFLFSVDELKKCCKIQNASPASPRKPPCCLPLPGKQDKIWIFLFASSNTHGRGVEVQQWCIVARSAHTLYKVGLTYNDYICMWGIRFDLHTVMQSQPVSEPSTHTHRVRQQMLP